MLDFHICVSTEKSTIHTTYMSRTTNDKLDPDMYNLQVA